MFAAIRINPMAAFFFPLIEASLARALQLLPVARRNPRIAAKCHPRAS
jgi:hypothetical protein